MLNRPLIFMAIMGTLITTISNHWLLAWIGLEINALAFIPLILDNQHPHHVEAAIKYFLIQATSSIIILFSFLMNTIINGQWTIYQIPTPMAIALTLALLMKLNIAPFHFWYTDILQGLTLPLGLMLATLQKIAPMILLLQVSNSVSLPMMIFLGILSIMAGGWGGINQTEIRKIWAYSSIAHMGWAIIILKINTFLALMAFTTYILLTLALFMNTKLLEMTSMTQLPTAWSKSRPLTIATMSIILSSAGMPPLTGFIPKLVIAMELAKFSSPVTGILFIMSLIPLFFYLRLTYTIITTSPPNPSSMTPQEQKTPSKTSPKTLLMTIILNTTAISLFPIVPMIFFSMPISF